MREVVIKTGSRLHFGLFALSAEHGRDFGGIGMMIDAPRVSLRVQPATATEIVAPDAVVGRIDTFASRFRETYPDTRPARIEVTEFIPSHHGLGSGTQLALAIGTALAKLSGREISPADVAKATGRGRRSAIGIHGFQSGGFLVDAGHTPDMPVGEIKQRIEVPAEWRIVLVTPTDSEGLSGQNELDAFSKLRPMPDTLTEELRERTLQHIAPALERSDFDVFAESLDAFGQRIGEFFAPVQGGVFRSNQALELGARLRADGVKAVVQSSWGPTVCVLTQTAADAESIVDLAGGLPTKIVAPANSGCQMNAVS